MKKVNKEEPKKKKIHLAWKIKINSNKWVHEWTNKRQKERNPFNLVEED